MAVFGKTNKHGASRILRTVTSLTGPRKGSTPSGIINRVRGGSKRSTYRRR